MDLWKLQVKRKNALHSLMWIDEEFQVPVEHTKPILLTEPPLGTVERRDEDVGLEAIPAKDTKSKSKKAKKKETTYGVDQHEIKLTFGHQRSVDFHVDPLHLLYLL